jgi:hypothetical protein
VRCQTRLSFATTREVAKEIRPAVFTLKMLIDLFTLRSKTSRVSVFAELLVKNSLAHENVSMKLNLFSLMLLDWSCFLSMSSCLGVAFWCFHYTPG